MKKLLFIGIVVLMVQSLGAVTLPSTSYSPYSASAPSDGGFTTTGGTMVTGSYSVLSAESYGCVEQYSSSKDVAGCQDCCDQPAYDAYGVGGEEECYYTPGCMDARNNCKNECARSLNNETPIDGGLSILLILSVAGGMVKAYRVKEQGSRNK